MGKELPKAGTGLSNEYSECLCSTSIKGNRLSLALRKGIDWEDRQKGTNHIEKNIFYIV